jgi:hypothetical protein
MNERFIKFIIKKDIDEMTVSSKGGFYYTFKNKLELKKIIYKNFTNVQILASLQTE